MICAGFELWIVDQDLSQEEPDVQFHPRLRKTLRCIGDVFEIQSKFEPGLAVALTREICSIYLNDETLLQFEAFKILVFI